MSLLYNLHVLYKLYIKHIRLYFLWKANKVLKVVCLLEIKHHKQHVVKTLKLDS